MDTKSLLIAISSFIAGGLLVSVAAVTFEKPETKTSDRSMTTMVESLKDKKGDAFDESFIQNMIIHHDGAIEMARLADDRAKHDEIKQLSGEIISAQQKEKDEMLMWQKQWDYETSATTHPSH